MENFNREEVKEEVLKLGKWKRFFFMVVYAFVLGFALNISIGIAFIQFLFYLFTSKINEALFNFNKQIFSFFDDTLNFLLFQTEEMPFPFNKSSNADEAAETAEIVEGEADLVDDEEPEFSESSEENTAEVSEEVDEEPELVAGIAVGLIKEKESSEEKTAEVSEEEPKP